MIVHCLFEQSGTFKNVFKKLGYQSYDYDILNDFKKPTQYWFINCEPKNNFVLEAYCEGGNKTINKTHNKVERSLINKNYAERFIKEFIL